MPLITALKSQQKPDRFNLFLDGEFVLGVSGQVCLNHNLRVGQEISAELLAQLIQEEELTQNLERAYRFLSYRPRSRFELENYFKKKKVSPKVIDLILTKLEEGNLVNDQTFAAWWVDQRCQFRPKGAVILRQELVRKGVAREIIDEILEQLESRLSSSNALEDLTRKAAKRYQHLDHLQQRQRLWAFLTRRGLSGKQIRPLIDKVLKSTYNSHSVEE